MIRLCGVSLLSTEVYVRKKTRGTFLKFSKKNFLTLRQKVMPSSKHETRLASGNDNLALIDRYPSTIGQQRYAVIIMSTNTVYVCPTRNVVCDNRQSIFKASVYM